MCVSIEYIYAEARGLADKLSLLGKSHSIIKDNSADSGGEFDSCRDLAINCMDTDDNTSWSIEELLYTTAVLYQLGAEFHIKIYALCPHALGWVLKRA